MPIYKFHEKNKALFLKVQSTEGTFETGIVSTDALAAFSVEGSVTYETGSYTYLGDSLSRDEITYQKDSYADVSIETAQISLLDTSLTFTTSNAPLYKAMVSAGASCFIDNTAKTVTYDNSIASNTLLSAEYRKASPDDATNDKVFKFKDLRASLDVSANISEVPKLKFSFKGNSDTPVAAAKLTADAGTQTLAAVPPVRQATIVTAQVAQLDGTFTSVSGTPTMTRTAGTTLVTASHTSHGLGAAGDIRAITVSGATGGDATIYNGVFLATITSANAYTYNTKSVAAANSSGTVVVTKGPAAATLCFATLNATNFFGFSYSRYLTGCAEGFAKGAEPSDVSVTVLEDQIGNVSFNPDAYVQNYFGCILKFGSVAGKYITYKWDKLQLANVKDGKVGNYEGRDITFRNTGRSYIIMA